MLRRGRQPLVYVSRLDIYFIIHMQPLMVYCRYKFVIHKSSILKKTEFVHSTSMNAITPSSGNIEEAVN